MEPLPPLSPARFFVRPRFPVRLLQRGASRADTIVRARLRCREAANALATIRQTLRQAVDLAYQQQSFSPLGALFDEEEAALAVYKRAVSMLVEAEERCFALSAALVYEKAAMWVGQMPPGRLN